ncbi:MAG: SIMPL domain-containing protein [Brevundimonas sp.]|nr:SIMPL domain-containing protein [Brevundimonas sp.]
MKSFACIAVAATVLALPATAQDSFANRPTIVVTGSSEVETKPDQFEVSISIEGRGATQVEALRALATAQSHQMESLPKLSGLTAGRVTTGDITVGPNHDPDCGTGEYDRDTSDCPIIGYSVGSNLTFTGSPAERAGDAISLASELEAVRARLNDYDLVDMRALQDAANRAAFADAERQARMLAEASGRRIVRILRIQDPSARVIDVLAQSPGEIGEVVVTGSRIQSAAVSIAVAPRPVTASARVTVVFEIE